MEEQKIFYLCDKKACGENHKCGNCRHTSQIEHAVNFEKKSWHTYEKVDERNIPCNASGNDVTRNMKLSDLP